MAEATLAKHEIGIVKGQKSETSDNSSSKPSFEPINISGQSKAGVQLCGWLLPTYLSIKTF